MPVLTKIKKQLYTLYQKDKTHIFRPISHEVYAKPEEVDTVDAEIISDKKTEDPKPVKKSNRKSSTDPLIKQNPTNSWSVKIRTKITNYTPSQKKQIKDSMYDALMANDSHKLIYELISQKLDKAAEKGFLTELTKLAKKKSLFHFKGKYFGKNYFTYLFVPNSIIPKHLMNQSMVQSIWKIIGEFELRELTDIKSVVAERV